MKHNPNLLRHAIVADLNVGDRVMDGDGDTGTLVAPSHPVTGEIVLSYGDAYGYCVFRTSETVYLPPLCWVEDKPVYPGDVLYWKGAQTSHQRQPFTAVAVGGLGDWVCKHPSDDIYRLNESELTWTPPKVKQEAWLNIYDCAYASHWPTKETADTTASPDRRACIRIEWEE